MGKLQTSNSVKNINVCVFLSPHIPPRTHTSLDLNAHTHTHRAINMYKCHLSTCKTGLYLHIYIYQYVIAMDCRLYSISSVRYRAGVCSNRNPNNRKGLKVKCEASRQFLNRLLNKWWANWHNWRKKKKRCKNCTCTKRRENIHIFLVKCSKKYSKVSSRHLPILKKQWLKVIFERERHTGKRLGKRNSIQRYRNKERQWNMSQHENAQQIIRFNSYTALNKKSSQALCRNMIWLAQYIGRDNKISHLIIMQMIQFTIQWCIGESWLQFRNIKCSLRVHTVKLIASGYSRH